MKPLRIAVVAAFFASVAVTALTYVFRQVHALHPAHIALTNATFLLIAAYLAKSAKLASLAGLRELRANFPPYDGTAYGRETELRPNSVAQTDCEITRGEVVSDESPLSGRRARVTKTAGDRLYRGSIIVSGAAAARGTRQRRYVADVMPEGGAVFNVCAAFLARSGIYVRGEYVLRNIAPSRKLTVRCAGANRAGLAKTRETLERMGVTLALEETGPESEIATGRQYRLCGFAEFDSYHDAVITHDKITHLLKLVYAARVYRRARAPVRFITVAAAGFAFGALCGFKLFALAALPFAVAGAVQLALLRRLEKNLARRVTFELVANTK
ncbi:MAG: hypothetical protein LBS90_06005 [Oscillospiraceae bacterium]|jgi:hypothetical protein|nr:hypothetical protein [Oscillospiraceae bacterium]